MEAQIDGARRRGALQANRLGLAIRIAIGIVALAASVACGVPTSSERGAPVRPAPDEHEPTDAPGSGGTGEIAIVYAIVDGDTLDVLVDTGPDRVRILGIDAPELHPDAECGGLEASDRLAGLVSPGSTVRLIADSIQPDRDRDGQSGRLLRYVETQQGVDVGREQLRTGLALVYRRSDSDRRGEYEEVEAGARSAGRGVHGELC